MTALVRAMRALRDLHRTPLRVTRASTLALQGRVRECYNPSTIFATISRWISDEPPKIV